MSPSAVSIDESSLYQNRKQTDVIRKNADFHPPIWGDRFLNYTDENKILGDSKKEERLRNLKEKLAREILIIDDAVNISKQLNVIDHIQRLGVAYHFEKEIEKALQHVYEAHDDYENNNLDDLYHVSLRFRMLRQQGYNISCDIFNKFKDNKGDFDGVLIYDTLGMLSLYEATHMRKQGEDILDGALVFTTHHLQLVQTKSQLSNHLASRVNHALKNPIRMSLPRQEAIYYMSIYEETDSPNQALLEFAKMDFNLVQSLHKRELSDITRWDIESMDELPEYMKHSYKAILDVYNEIETEMIKDGKPYSVHYAKEGMKRQAYFQEAKWYNEEYVPTLEEYINNALVSSVYPLMMLTSFVGVEGKLATKEVFDWVFNVPNIVKASSIIGRLLDDIVSHQFEQDRGHVASAVECCMKEYGISEEEACTELRKRITDEWKIINEECLKPTEQEMALLKLGLNLTSAAEVFYKEGDSFTNVGKEMRSRIAGLLMDPMPI